MKRCAMAVAAVLVVSASFTAFAEETGSTDECFLAAKDCQGAVDSLQQKIAKLNTEIAKEEGVYSPEELKRLDEKLKEANDLSVKTMSNP
jgi:Skp family chaperone for outer membrane proteins